MLPWERAVYISASCGVNLAWRRIEQPNYGMNAAADPSTTPTHSDQKRGPPPLILLPPCDDGKGSAAGISTFAVTLISTSASGEARRLTWTIVLATWGCSE